MLTWEQVDVDGYCRAWDAARGVWHYARGAEGIADAEQALTAMHSHPTRDLPWIAKPDRYGHNLTEAELNRTGEG